MVVRRWLVIFSLLIGVSACSRQPAAKRYELQGRVVAVDSGSSQLTIAHQEIPGLMEAMTMPYTVSDKDAWIFKTIAPGDQVHATLVLGERAELQEVSFSRTSGGDATNNTNSPALPGAQVPDFSLVNQSGRTIHFQQFRGKPLLLTFVYTRCPFPDYCPRMSNNFAQVLQKLKEDPRAFDKAQLLSISIDPDHDKPPVLRSYGERYVGHLDPMFAHWEFASGTPQEVRKAAEFFGLAYNQKDGQIVHGLVTVLVDKDGKVAKVYSGNDWKAEEVASDFVKASGA